MNNITLQKILIRNVRLLDPATQQDRITHVMVENGKIAAIDDHLDFSLGDATTPMTQFIDATGLWLIPSSIDLCARLREPGFAHQGYLQSELKAASKAGIGYVVCPPDTDPILDEAGLVDMLYDKARRVGASQVRPLGALTDQLKGEQLTEMAELFHAGCVGFSQGHTPIKNTKVLQSALQYANTFGFTVWFKPQDCYLSKGGVAATSLLATTLGLSQVPQTAEVIALQTIITLVQATQAKVHIGRVTTRQGVQLIAKAKSEGLPITADTGLYYLFLQEENIFDYNSLYRFDPPIRDKNDQEALWQGLADGTLDAVCSDHVPVSVDEKLQPFETATPGATSLELLLPLLLGRAKDQTSDNLLKTLALITQNPAKICGIDHNTAKLAVGCAADMVLYNPQASWSINAQNLISKSHLTPLQGQTVTGQVVAHWLNGVAIYEYPHHGT